MCQQRRKHHATLTFSHSKECFSVKIHLTSLTRCAGIDQHGRHLWGLSIPLSCRLAGNFYTLALLKRGRNLCVCVCYLFVFVLADLSPATVLLHRLRAALRAARRTHGGSSCARTVIFLLSCFCSTV